MCPTASISHPSASKIPKIKKVNKKKHSTLGWGTCEKMLRGMKFASTEAHIYIYSLCI